MGITLFCSCGKKFKAKDSSVGKKVKCPSCGESQRVDAPGEDEEADSRPKKRRSRDDGDRKKKKKRHTSEGWLQHSILGLRVGAWLIVLGVLGASAVALVVILPKALPALSNDPFYTVESASDHLLVTLYNTNAGDFQVKVRKRPVRQDFGTLGVASGLPEFELPSTKVEGKRTIDGKTASYEIECTKSGITEVRCDGRTYKLSHW